MWDNRTKQIFLTLINRLNRREKKKRIRLDGRLKRLEKLKLVCLYCQMCSFLGVVAAGGSFLEHLLCLVEYNLRIQRILQ